MKRNYYLALILLLALPLFTACEDKETTDIDPNTADYTALLTNYANTTIIPTYADMKDNAIVLFNDVTAFQNSGEQADLDAACESWKKTRAPWERSEAFLFGPASYNNLDPQLDSWPLDQAQLMQILEGSQELSADYVREGLGPVLRGFHASEYLLFRDGEKRTVATITAREIDYLLAVVEVLQEDCITLWGLWAGVESGSYEADVLDGIGIEVGTPYIDEFLNAGNAGSRYVAQRDAVDEIIQGIIGIADEVANAKLAEPYTTKDVYVVESWHSWNSLTDFKNNILSIQNAYTSSYNGTTADSSLSDLVASKDEALDTEVKAKIEAALTALGKIQEPYRNSLNDEVNIPAAMDAISAVMTIFDEEVGSTVFE